MYICSQRLWNVCTSLWRHTFLLICLHLSEDSTFFFKLTFNFQSKSQKFLYTVMKKAEHDFVLHLRRSFWVNVADDTKIYKYTILTTRQLYRFSNLFSNLSKSPANSEISLNNFNISSCESTPSSGLASLLITGRTLSHI